MAAEDAPATPLLEVRDLRTRFNTPRGVFRAVDGVSFTLHQGETIGIVGESGSGKSVLARSIMDLLPPTASVSGEITFHGASLATLPRAARRHFWGPKIAMIYQDPMTSLNPTKRVGQQIIDPLRYHLRLSREAATRRALELLEHVRIPEARKRLRQYPHELSGGMRQRVMIAIALSCRPQLIIADEPTTALDVTIQKQILDLLASIQRELGMAMILITHDLGVVAGRTDRVAVMYAGQIAEVADTQTLFTSVRHRYTEALLRSIPRIAQPSHVRLDAIAGRPPDMADPPPGCRFAPRCPHARSKCREIAPTPEPGPGRDHLFSCFYPTGVPAPDVGARGESAEA
jgi:peptide/nickel transport system ATP-binding protein